MSDDKVSPGIFDAVSKVSFSGSKVFNYKFIIEDIKTAIDEFPNGKRILGDEFKIPMKYSSLLCHINVYPSGSGENGWLSLFLYAKPPNGMDFKMHCEYAVINADGEKVEVGEIEEDDVSTYIDGWGDDQFIRHTDIFDASKKILKNGSLTLAFKITILHNDAVIKSSNFASGRVADSKDHSRFMNKLQQGFMNDFIIVTAGQKEVPCHAIVLAANSEYFEGMLAHDSKEKQEGRVELLDLEKETCQIILKYLYTGCLDEKDATMQLYKQSDKLLFLQLKDVLSKHLCQYIDMDNCIKILQLADGTNDENLKSVAADFINENTEELIHRMKTDIYKDHDLWSYLQLRLAKRIKMA